MKNKTLSQNLLSELDYFKEQLVQIVDEIVEDEYENITILQQPFEQSFSVFDKKEVERVKEDGGFSFEKSVETDEETGTIKYKLIPKERIDWYGMFGNENGIGSIGMKPTDWMDHIEMKLRGNGLK